MRIAVFCGSKAGNRPEYVEAAEQLGRMLAKRRIGLVYGAGHVGLMGVLADAALAAGGEVIGVIPTSMVEAELAHRQITELIIVGTMHERKALMAEKADAFMALPGGFGTADEFFEIVTWKQIGLHAKPIGLLNVGGYFDPLLAWIDKVFDEGFASVKYRSLIEVSTTIDDLLDRLLSKATPAA
jgi:uncharacterized protein (TIGR00730 family)